MARQCCQMMSESKGHFGPVSAVSILLAILRLIPSIKRLKRIIRMKPPNLNIIH